MRTMIAVLAAVVVAGSAYAQKPGEYPWPPLYRVRDMKMVVEVLARPTDARLVEEKKPGEPELELAGDTARNLTAGHIGIATSKTIATIKEMFADAKDTGVRGTGPHTMRIVVDYKATNWKLTASLLRKKVLLKPSGEPLWTDSIDGGKVEKSMYGSVGKAADELLLRFIKAWQKAQVDGEAMSPLPSR